MSDDSLSSYLREENSEVGGNGHLGLGVESTE